MKNFLKCFLIFLFVATSVASASAYTLAFQNWGFNPNVGSTGLISSIDEITLLGLSLTNSVQTVQGVPGDGTFSSFTTMQSSTFQNDNNNILYPASTLGIDYELTMIMRTNGYYKLNTTTLKNDLFFTDGWLEIYIDNNRNYGFDTDPTYIYGANDGLKIATFNLLNGTGTMDWHIINPDGRTDLIFEATFLKEGYWFDTNGNNMAYSPHDPLVLGFTDSNNTILNDPSTVAINEFLESGLFYTSAGKAANLEFFLSSNGSFAPAPNPVPEPATMILLGWGLIGIAGWSRKLTKK